MNAGLTRVATEQDLPYTVLRQFLKKRNESKKEIEGLLAKPQYDVRDSNRKRKNVEESGCCTRNGP